MIKKFKEFNKINESVDNELSTEEIKWMKDMIWSQDNSEGFEPKDEKFRDSIYSKLDSQDYQLSTEEKKWLENIIWSQDNSEGFEPRDEKFRDSIYSKLSIS